MGLRVGVFGAGGRMGAEVCRAVAADADLDLVAVVDPGHGGADLDALAGPGLPSLEIDGDAQVMAEAAVDVAVDFTVADAGRENLTWLADHGVHAVVGTTGFSDADLERFETAFTTSNCVIAPNFAIGAVLMMHFAEMAAPYFETAEVIEYHHDRKVDAPSGTAMLTAERMAAAKAEWPADPTEREVVEGARGGRVDGRVPVHSVRMHGMVAHQEVILGTTGQSLTLRHDSYDRASFMPGVLLAVKAVTDAPGLTFGLDQLLDL